MTPEQAEAKARELWHSGVTIQKIAEALAQTHQEAVDATVKRFGGAVLTKEATGSLDKSLLAMILDSPTTDESSEVQKLKERVQELEGALSPFAKFARSLFNGRRGVPVSGAWYSLDPGAPSEAEITIEDLKAARAVLEKGEKK